MWQFDQEDTKEIQSAFENQSALNKRMEEFYDE